MTKPSVTNAPLVLVIRDGWGENPHPEHASFNAVEVARSRGLLPVDDMLRRDWPRTLVKTSGEDVGLPDGTMGNSEVGHQNIGAGRIVDQESVAITKACRAGLEKNAAIAGAVTRAKAAGKSVHVMGINSDAGVHGLLEHLFAVLRACKALGMPSDRVFVHLFADGRDTGPFTGLEFARRVETACREIGVGRIASVVGRYFAMDRDSRWERVAQAYALLTGYRLDVGWDTEEEAMAWYEHAPWTEHSESEQDAETFDHVHATAPVFASVIDAIQDYYDDPGRYQVKTGGEALAGDEFILPRIIAGSPEEAARSRIATGDSVIFYNYRGDRPREIGAALMFSDEHWAKVKPSPDSGRVGFDRGRRLDLHMVTMTAYWEELAPYVTVAFPKPPKMQNISGEYVSSLGLRQFRCAETEKYPHVTFFFNDYRDPPFPGETRENPPSPKGVATYDLAPEMSADQVRDAVLRRLAAPDAEQLIVVNFANGDMVGHTGVLEAAVKACAKVDACVGAIIEATLKRGGSLIVTADHGNCEQMFDPETNSPHTAHTVYDVPLYVVGAPFKGRRLRGDASPAGWFDPKVRDARGRLADIMPTALAMLGLAKPREMTGESLLA